MRFVMCAFVFSRRRNILRRKADAAGREFGEFAGIFFLSWNA